MNQNRQSPTSAEAVSTRPLQRVLNFLAAEIHQGGRERRRLPTIREIGERLDVSPRTVQKAFHQYAQAGRIESVTGRGTFTIPQGKSAAEAPLRIGLNIELDHYDPVNAWAYTIHGAILQAVLTSGRNAVFANIEDEYRRQARPPIDGFILLPGGADIRERLREAWPKAPAVFLNPPVVAATANFVSPDYHGIGFALGNAWRECGKKRLVFLNNPTLAHSPSGQLFISGLLSGLGDAHDRLDYLRLLTADDFTAAAGAARMREFLKEEKRIPDAIFCKGDFLALGALEALREAGSRVPDETSVVGGSGLDLSETRSPQLTRCRQPFQQLGEALFSMLLTRIEQDGSPQPGRFLPTPFIGGSTTTAAENELLLAAEVPPAPFPAAVFP